MSLEGRSSNLNPKPPENITPKFDIEAKLEEFLSLDDDNWDEIINAGIPLYKKLKEAGDPRVETVANTLRNLSVIIERSGSDSPAGRASFVRQIEEGLR